jgi:hypothetical protein
MPGEFVVTRRSQVPRPMPCIMPSIDMPSISIDAREPPLNARVVNPGPPSLSVTLEPPQPSRASQPARTASPASPGALPGAAGRMANALAAEATTTMTAAQAARRGRIDVLRDLLQRDAAALGRRESRPLGANRYPLALLAEARNQAGVTLILEGRAAITAALGRPFDIDAVDGDGKSALHYAIGADSLKIVVLLLRADADPTKAGPRKGIVGLLNGHTYKDAFIYAVHKNRPAIVAHLLAWERARARPGAPFDLAGGLALAERRGFTRVASILAEHRPNAGE